MEVLIKKCPFSVPSIAMEISSILCKWRIYSMTPRHFSTWGRDSSRTKLYRCLRISWRRRAVTPPEIRYRGSQNKYSNLQYGTGQALSVGRQFLTAESRGWILSYPVCFTLFKTGHCDTTAFVIIPPVVRSGISCRTGSVSPFELTEGLPNGPVLPHSQKYSR